MSKFIIFLGISVILHAAYSAVHFKHLLSRTSTEVDIAFPPQDVIIEVILGFLVCLSGVLLTAGELKPISLAEDDLMKSMDLINSRPDFNIFNHRGRALRARNCANENKIV